MTSGADQSYIGSAAYALKIGAVGPSTDLQDEIGSVITQCDADDLLADDDILCITESIVARAENNFVTVDEVVSELREKIGIAPDDTILVLFPIVSRNRFAPILQAISRAVEDGTVIVQSSFPDDEVGNRVVQGDLDVDETYEYETLRDMEGVRFEHPITEVDYFDLYRSIITEEGANAEIILSNDRVARVTPEIDHVLVSTIHRRERDATAIMEHTTEQGTSPTVFTLDDICNEGERSCRWGLLGSNLSAGENIKLAPRAPFDFVKMLQAQIEEDTGKQIGVLIYGDGAYKDPDTGIYELADPVAAFGYTDDLANTLSSGVKYKFLADRFREQGLDPEEIDRRIRAGEVEASDEGTTPRNLPDLAASLADLLTGSADAGTPLVLIKDYR